MIKIGITGSIASGKSTAAQLIAKKKFPLFSADKAVLDLYKNNRLNLDGLITKYRPLEEVNEAFDYMNKGLVARSILTFK